MIFKPWMKTLQWWTHAVDTAKRFTLPGNAQVAKMAGGRNRWIMEHYSLTKAEPFYWSADTVKTVLATSKLVPLDTQIITQNFRCLSSWWYLETPIELKTTLDPEDSGIYALHVGIIESDQELGILVNCWIHFGPNKEKFGPSQSWVWYIGETIDTMQKRVVEEHRNQVATKGIKPMPTDYVVENCIAVGKFLLAGNAWLASKLSVEEQTIERHERKRFKRERKTEPPRIKVVELRKRDQPKREPTGEEPKHVDWKTRWIVDGHWRNQPIGPGRSERKLIWIEPFVKGPEDKPLVTEKQKKLFVVDR